MRAIRKLKAEVVKLENPFDKSLPSYAVVTGKDVWSYHGGKRSAEVERVKAQYWLDNK